MKKKSTKPMLFAYRKPQTLTRRGLRHDDDVREVKVMLLGKDSIGVAVRNKQSGYGVKFGSTIDGARILGRFLTQVASGKTKTWKEMARGQWVPISPFRKKSRSKSNEGGRK